MNESLRNKFIIVGFNGSGKMQVANTLKSMGLKVGNTFRSSESIGNQYSLSTVVYDSKEVNNLFENQSYLFIKESLTKSNKYYEGISFYEYQNNDVFIMSPDQFNMVPKFDDNVIFVWLDNNVAQRHSRYRMEKRKYDFLKQEKVEQEFVHDFTDRIGDNAILYFFNEEPERVAAILYGVIKHPDLLDFYLNSFN
jgi:hypothetical protein